MFFVSDQKIVFFFLFRCLGWKLEKTSFPFLCYVWQFFVFVKGCLFLKSRKNTWIFVIIRNICNYKEYLWFNTQKSSRTPHLFSSTRTFVQFVHLKKQESYFTNLRKVVFVSKTSFFKTECFFHTQTHTYRKFLIIEKFLYIPEVANWEVCQFDISFVLQRVMFSQYRNDIDSRWIWICHFWHDLWHWLFCQTKNSNRFFFYYIWERLSVFPLYHTFFLWTEDLLPTALKMYEQYIKTFHNWHSFLQYLDNMNIYF